MSIIQTQRINQQRVNNKEYPVFLRNRLRMAVALILFAGTSLSVGAQKIISQPEDTNVPSNMVKVQQPAAINQQSIAQPIHQPRIQMAILLDTSSSMDGLIDQTRNQLWSVVNEFSSAKRNGLTPILEVALFEYGNDGNSMSEGYVRQLSGFTRELDKVSEGLFSLRTNGGSEFCGVAIKTAVKSLQWSQSNNDIKTIFIAGNEAFTQGPVHYQEAVKLASQQGISVNTIFAGDYQAGINIGWKSGAMLAGGDYMNIDADRQVVHMEAPQDEQIAALNQKLNSTYVPYGEQGKTSAERQIKQDQQSQSISSGLLAKRVKSKSSSFYNNSNWDLVDALEEGKLKDEDLATLKEQELPAAMQKLNIEERKQFIQLQAKARKEIKQEISQLSVSRDVYVAKQKREIVEESASMSDALSTAIKKQALQKDFKFDIVSQDK